MYQLSIGSFAGGFLFGCFLAGLLVFAFNFESKVSMQSDWDARYEVFESAVTENRRLVDRSSDRTILWAPGNPKNIVTEVKEIAPNRWQVTIEKVY